MKKRNRILKTFLVVSLLLFLITSLCSCVFAITSPKLVGNLPYEVQDKIVDSISDPMKKAEMLYGLGLNNLERATSSTYKENLHIKYDRDTLGELRLDVDATQKIVYEDGKLNMSLRSNYDSTVKISGKSARTSLKMTEGYQDGMMFVKPDDKMGLYSELSQKEYLKHLEDRSGMKLSVLDCSNATYTMTEDGFHQIVLSGYSEEVLKAYKELIEDYDSYAPPYTLSDVTTTIKIDKNYWIYETVTEFVFDYKTKNYTMICKLKSTYSEINETEIDKNDFDFFTKVDDLRQLYTLTDVLTETPKATKGQIIQNYELQYGRENQNLRESVDFLNTDSSLKYTIDTTNGSIVYANGSLSIYDKNGNKLSGTSASKDEAFPLVQVYFNPLSITAISPNNIKKVTKGEKDIYTLTVTQDIKDTVIPSLVGKSTGYSPQTVDVEIVITVENGRMTAYDYSIATKHNDKDVSLVATTQYTKMEFPEENPEE